NARMAVSGANFAVAETGTLVVVESEGNGRMCLTLPEVLVSVVGIEKVVPTFAELDVFMQLLPRSSTGERMNPYTSTWSGVTPGDGPQEVHVVLLDNGRTRALADEVGRQALRCIRCSACLNVCPVYSRVGGHAYESVYPGPIGAILTPQLHGMREGRSLPYASSLCGACEDVCPVAIEIPRILVHLRGRVVDTSPSWQPEKAAMKSLYRVFASRRSFEAAQRAARLGSRPLARRGRIARLPWPLSGWTETRDLPEPPAETFRDWWRRERGEGVSAPVAPRVLRFPCISRQTSLSSPADPPAETGDARSAILGRIRAALADRPQPPAVPREYRRATDRSRSAIVDHFAERAGEYRATVRRAGPGELRTALTELCRERGAKRLAVPADLPADWRPDHVELVVDTNLSPLELDDVDGALTGCARAIAETGTSVLDGGARQGRRALTLVPDYHLCVISERAICDLVPEAVERLEEAVGQGRPLTFISGPSATSDIELNRVEGVHGPRTLHVLIAG
ncbi:MAG: L-lactate dehydrogenase complex protein LldF, partial [Thermoleophilaceae bacterium]|nr:L-lactate dehydrogenase complex protein LldF [Thermoleophilaceae bacterium]